MMEYENGCVERFIYGMLDNTLECHRRGYNIKYAEDFLSSISLPSVTYREHFLLKNVKPKKPYVVLRHDVDHSLRNALAMARVESNLGIRATYFLLHPDGVASSRNYFGEVKNGKLTIFPWLIDAALWLQDHGHEVGIHNDLISLWAGTGIQPGEALESMLTTLRKNGVHISGMIAHGSALCYSLHFVNSEIFVEASNYAKKFQRKEQNILTLENGRSLPLFQLKMEDFGLEYIENKSSDYDINYSDSDNKMALVIHGKRYDFKAKNETFESAIQNGFLSCSHPPRMHALVHPCHWTFEFGFRENLLKEDIYNVVLNKYNKELYNKYSIMKKSKNIIQSMPNIDVFKSYNQIYISDKTHFSQQAYVEFVKRCLHFSSNKSSVLELGCGQGELLYESFCFMKEEQASSTDDVVAVGVDGSFVAITDCAIKYPECKWVVADVKSFLDGILEKDVLYAGLPQQYGIILDKTGLTMLRGFPEAYAVLKKIHEILAPDGYYIYMASKDFYERLYKDRKKWPLHWIQIVNKIFGSITLSDEIPNCIALICKK